MYKKAQQQKLRFQTTLGLLSTEQLFDLNLSQLASAIKNVKKILTKDNDDELSFLVEETKVDVKNQLRFDILKDVYLTKKQERDAQANEAAKKVHNQKILELIAQKQDQELREMSKEELEALLK